MTILGLMGEAVTVLTVLPFAAFASFTAVATFVPVGLDIGPTPLGVAGRGLSEAVLGDGVGLPIFVLLDKEGLEVRGLFGVPPLDFPLVEESIVI